MKLIFTIFYFFLLVQNQPKILGHWFEGKETKANYYFYQKSGKFFVKLVFKNNQEIIEEVKCKKISEVTDLIPVDNSQGEYYRISITGDLQFLNKQNKVFAVGVKI